MTFENKLNQFETELELADYETEHNAVAIIEIASKLIKSKTELLESDFDLLVNFCDRLLDNSDLDCDEIINLFCTNSIQQFITELRTDSDKLFNKFTQSNN